MTIKFAAKFKYSSFQLVSDNVIIGHVLNLRFIDIACFVVIQVYHKPSGFSLFFAFFRAYLLYMLLKFICFIQNEHFFFKPSLLTAISFVDIAASLFMGMTQKGDCP